MRLAIILLLLLAGCQQYDAPQPRQFAFRSQSIVLPPETVTLPNDLVSNNCGACHSLDLITRQPKLKPEQWAATVKKMREAYRAPIAETDDPQLVAALTSLPTQR